MDCGLIVSAMLKRWTRSLVAQNATIQSDCRTCKKHGLHKTSKGSQLDCSLVTRRADAERDSHELR
jgi:hypothetical protein